MCRVWRRCENKICQTCRYDKPFVGRSFEAKKENESMYVAGGVLWYSTFSSIEHGGTSAFFTTFRTYSNVGPPECIFIAPLALQNPYL